jgi:nitrite reductase/ring-hydroxylating ferredoxin subunit
VGAALAAIAGATDLFTVVPERSSAKKRGYVHGGLNVLALLLFIVVAVRRGGAAAMPDGLSLLLSAAAVIVVAISGWLGGTLVYRNQIGVDHRYANAGKYRERELRGWDQPVCNQSELSDGQMILAYVGTRKIVVGRCPEGVVAFSNMCTHRGGPLSDGALVGCTVQCPWHGSQFNVHTGRVVAGPANQAIDTYKVEVRNGEVFVSPNVTRTEPVSTPAPEGDRRVA